MFTPLTPLRCLARARDLYGRKEALVCGENRFTYTQFGDRCDRLSGLLSEKNIRAGDRVAYLSFNTHKLLEGYFGVVQASGVVMPLNVRLAPAELAAILNHSEARFLFYEADFTSLIPEFQRNCPEIAHYIPLDNSYGDALARATPLSASLDAIDENSLAELFYTSGSTGVPKGVALSHRSLYLHALSVAVTFHQNDTAVELHTIPLFHANGWGRPQATTLMGAKHVMVRRFDPAAIFRLIETERATSMSLVPTMANALLDALLDAPRKNPDAAPPDFSSLREIHLGGAASSPELIARLEKSFGCSCMAGYGLTETSPVAASARPKNTAALAGDHDEAARLRRLSAAGWPVPGVQIRVVDSLLSDVPRNMSSVGEVIIAGDHVMEGYFRDPEATAAAMTGPWFHTGDMAVWDDESYIRIVDRKKDIIVTGGENVSSLEVEHAIAAHPAVVECAVVAAPDPKWGEIPVAFIVRRADLPLTHEDLLRFLENRIAKFKMPRLTEFVDTPLPKTGTGKILKRELREKFWIGREDRVQG